MRKYVCLRVSMCVKQCMGVCANVRKRNVKGKIETTKKQNNKTIHTPESGWSCCCCHGCFPLCQSEITHVKKSSDTRSAQVAAFGQRNPSGLKIKGDKRRVRETCKYICHDPTSYNAYVHKYVFLPLILSTSMIRRFSHHLTQITLRRNITTTHNLFAHISPKYVFFFLSHTTPNARRRQSPPVWLEGYFGVNYTRCNDEISEGRLSRSDTSWGSESEFVRKIYITISLSVRVSECVRTCG